MGRNTLELTVGSKTETAGQISNRQPLSRQRKVTADPDQVIKAPFLSGLSRVVLASPCQ